MLLYTVLEKNAVYVDFYPWVYPISTELTPCHDFHATFQSRLLASGQTRSRPMVTREIVAAYASEAYQPDTTTVGW